MFGCTDLWIGKRFEPALTAFLNGERERRELRAQEAIDAGAVDRLYDAWRAECGGAPRAWWDESAVPGDAFSGWDSTAAHVPLGRTHVVPSNRDTVALGVFDPKREPVTTVDSGDVVVYRDTWTHFLNRLQPGVTIDELAAMRAECRGRGVHSIVGPVAVRGAMPGDVVQLRTLRLETIDFGANFHNPRSIGTGALPDDFEHGHIEYFSLDAERGFVEFDPRIRLTLRPFQGTLGRTAPPRRQHRPQGPHGRELAVRTGRARRRARLHRGLARAPRRRRGQHHRARDGDARSGHPSDPARERPVDLAVRGNRNTLDRARIRPQPQR